MKIGADLSDANIVFLQYPRLPCARITWTGKNKSAHAGAFVFSPEMKRSVTQDNSGENRFIPSPWKGHQTNASQARIQKRNRARARAHTHTRTDTHTHTYTHTHTHTFSLSHTSPSPSRPPSQCMCLNLGHTLDIVMYYGTRHYSPRPPSPPPPLHTHRG